MQKNRKEGRYYYTTKREMGNGKKKRITEANASDISPMNSLTHLRNLGCSIRHATFFNFLPPIRETLICVVAEPSVHAMQEPVDPVESPPLIKKALVVQVKDGLKETAAQLPEVRILAQFPLDGGSGLPSGWHCAS
jgi:hypothetical protein